MKNGISSSATCKALRTKESDLGVRFETLNSSEKETVTCGHPGEMKKSTLSQNVSTGTRKFEENILSCKKDLEVCHSKNSVKRDKKKLANSELFINFENTSKGGVSFPIIKNVFTLSPLGKVMLKTQLNSPITPPCSPPLFINHNAISEQILVPSKTFSSREQEKTCVFSTKFCHQREVMDPKAEDDNRDKLKDLPNNLYTNQNYEDRWITYTIKNPKFLLNCPHEDSLPISNANCVSSEGKYSKDTIVTSREYKVLQLKRKLQEQELALKKLRTQF